MKFFIKTYGCSHNQADSLFMAEILIKEGCTRVNDEKDADVIIVNTCTVKTPTEHKIMRYLHDHKDKKVIIAGCMTATHKEKLKKYPLIGCNNLSDITKIIKGELKNTHPDIHSVPLSKNEVIEIIPISKGCLGDCTYCATRLARGKLCSYNASEIISHIKKALKGGKKELWLTAEDTGCYGLDEGSNLPQLLKEIAKIKGFFKIRLGMINPKYAKKYRKDLAELLNNEKFYRFIHIPLQSGSDKILKSMNRHYSAKDFINTVNYLRKKAKDLTIATDIIVGFPKESAKDYELTYKLIDEIKPEVLNISKYSIRPLTLAAKMPQLPENVKKERAVKLMKLHKKHISERTNDSLKGHALVDEPGIARTNNYTKVRTKKNLGELIILK